MKTDDFLNLTPFEKEVINQLKKCSSNLNSLTWMVGIVFFLSIIGLLLTLVFSNQS